MTCDLHRVFSPVLARLPIEEDQCFTFRASEPELLARDAELTTDRLVIQKGTHEYDSYYRADSLSFFAAKDTYRELALLTLSLLFGPAVPRVQLALSHPQSHIKRLALFPGIPVERRYQVRPFALDYWTADFKQTRAPVDTIDDPIERPCFYLTNEDDMVGSEADWANRDTIHGFGTDQANVWLSVLLLNFGRATSTSSEFALEGSAGTNDVGAMSAEARFWLPGSDGWDPRLWP